MTQGPQSPLPAALAAGNKDAYAQLLDLLGDRLLRMANTILQNPADAEDAVQDAFANLIRHRHRFAHVLDLQAYVFAALRHAALHRLEQQKTHLRRLRQMPASPPAEPPSHDADALHSALAVLPHEQREIVSLKIDAGLTFAQISEVLRISPNTAASRYRYALEKLRALLDRP